MNKYLKLGLVCLSLLCGIQSKAVDQSTAATAAATNSIIQASARIQSIIIANDVASALTVKFFDAPTNVLTYVNAAYTNYLSYTTNIVSVYTTPAGVLQTNTNSGIYTYASTVSAATNAYRTVATINVGASGTTVYYPTNGLIVAFGLCVTNNTNCTITTTYSPSR